MTAPRLRLRPAGSILAITAALALFWLGAAHSNVWVVAGALMCGGAALALSLPITEDES